QDLDFGRHGRAGMEQKRTGNEGNGEERPRGHAATCSWRWLGPTLACGENLERAKGLEPSTPTLARSSSTTELHPHPRWRRLVPDNGEPMPNAHCECNTSARR